ncbi:hypothetical protein EHS11_04770 [Leptospira ilyithenensis]|uniref:Transposase n=1 Tax=Leptospira ilyithenensis TaxID=2484901 RepID=A0A4R9LSZ7_9LEPT|nr:hypothetical protein [Leptospira ilyithenensis]TGN13210.1 hypothetical protein EHS11_04770 [Leptospira ilyithenensis]
MIETFFKTLKSGCKIEEHQFQTFERLQRVLAIDSIIAWRILFLTTLGGHLGEKGDGHPGVLALARGLYKLRSAAIMWKLLTYG